MRIGLAYNLKSDFSSQAHHPPDELEEYDCEETIYALQSAISNGQHATVLLGGGRTFLHNILKQQVDLVFNIAEGWGGRSREAQVPAILELLDIPYTGSDPTTLVLSQDKARLKLLLTEADIPTPAYRVIRGADEIEDVKIPFPLIVKPAYEGSSKGIRLNSVVYTAEELKERVTWLLETYHQPALVEEYIKGVELTVGIVGNSPPKVIGVMQIHPKNSKSTDFVYSLEVKRDWQNQVEYICPPELSAKEVKLVTDAALRAYHLLDCRDMARVDIRFSATSGIPYFIEINPLPGLNPNYSDLCIMAGKMGLAYDKLIQNILDSACRRYQWKS